VVADPVGRSTGPGRAGGDGVHQVNPAVAVEHDRLTGRGVDGHDEYQRSLVHDQGIYAAGSRPGLAASPDLLELTVQFAMPRHQIVPEVALPPAR
jgi:hypothetical protein